MKVLFDADEPIGSPTSATIGNFDGVHMGHKRILAAVKQSAAEKGVGSCVITFHPHPQKVLRNIDVPLLLPMRERLRLLEAEGIDYAACYTFTKEIAAMTAEEFVNEILVGRLHIKHLIVGLDFSFGKNREGHAELLRELGEKHGFEIEVAEPFTIDGEVVSSSAIRNLLRAGDMKKAAAFLGYNFYIDGTVGEGEKRGRQIGYPTANLETDWEILPKEGVYATRASVDGVKHDSITNIGYRPTFGDSKLLIETHIFDFSGNIYNKRLAVEFVRRIRDERRFESVDALVEQIGKDVEQVKQALLAAGK
ncbi:MAG: bifunctional riboflavin kinase/FAD synthetase [Candidatus Dadabacteria bacterium]